MSDNNNDSFAIGTAARGGQICSLCGARLQQVDDYYQCTKCKEKYFPHSEVIEEDDEMVSVHEDEQVELGGISGGGPGLMVEPDDTIMKPTYDKDRPRIPIKSGETLVNIEYQDPSTQ